MPLRVKVSPSEARTTRHRLTLRAASVMTAKSHDRPLAAQAASQLSPLARFAQTPVVATTACVRNGAA